MCLDLGARPRAAASLLSTYAAASASAADASASSRDRPAAPPALPAPKVSPRAASVAESRLASARASASEAAPEAASEALRRSLEEPRRSVAVSIPCFEVGVEVEEEVFFLFRRRRQNSPVPLSFVSFPLVLRANTPTVRLARCFCRALVSSRRVAWSIEGPAEAPLLPVPCSP